MSFNQENNVDNQVVDLAMSYYTRDLEMGLTFNEIKDKALTKLGYNNESIQNYIKRMFIRFVNNRVCQFNNYISVDLENFNMHCNFDNNYHLNFYQLFNEFRMQDIIINNIQERLNKFNILSNINNHYDFYSSMTVNELMHLGY